jgi:hypothetical protein
MALIGGRSEICILVNERAERAKLARLARLAKSEPLGSARSISSVLIGKSMPRQLGVNYPLTGLIDSPYR